MTGRLHPDDIEAIARRVIELQSERVAPSEPALVDATALAHGIGMSRAYVYEHAHELGAVKVGDGKKPRLRFDLDVALAAFSALTDKPKAPEQPVRRSHDGPGRRRQRLCCRSPGSARHERLHGRP